MRRGKELLFSILIIIAAIIGGGLCIRHYGMGVHAYYRQKLEDVTLIVQGACWLEDGTIIEQRYVNRESYMVGVDLLMLGTGEGCEGTLCVQLCDYDGNVLSQKNEELSGIEDGQFYTIKFLEAVDVRDHDFLMIRIFAEGSNRTPGIVTISSLDDIKDNINCSVNDEVIYDNLAIMYIYGAWKYVGYTWKNNGVLEAAAASIILIILGAATAIYLFWNRDKIKIRAAVRAWSQTGGFKQLLYVLWFFCIFLGSSVIYKLRNHESVPIGVYIYLLLIAGISLCHFSRRKQCRNEKSAFIEAVNDKGIITVILLSTLMRIPLFVSTQLWDGSIYYGLIQRACSGFEYTFSYIWDYFRLAGHYAIVYTLFVAIGEFLFPNNMMGVLMVMLVMTDCALVCIYKMFRNYWLHLPQREAVIGTMLVSTCPLVLGLFSNISLEQLLFIFTVFLLYAEYKGQTMMKAVWLISLMLTKETGVVIAGGYLMVRIAVHLRDTIKCCRSGKIHYFLADFNVVCALGGILLVCLYTIKQKGLFIWFGMNQRHGDNIILEYIENIPKNLPLFWHKLKLLFVLHFQWIPVAVILVCIIYDGLKRRKKLAFKGRTSFLGMLGIFLLLNIYLIQFELGRYHIYSAAMLWILAYILLFRTFNAYLQRRIYAAISIIVIVLLLVQNFYFIDPLTNLAFDRFDSGKGKMVATEIAGGNKGDAFTNNFRHTYLYGLLDKMLENGAYDENTQILIPYEKDYLYFYAWAGYDTVEKRRVICSSPDSEDIIEISNAFLDDILEIEPEKMPERAILYFLPYVDGDEQTYVAKAKQFFEVSERKEVSNWGGALSYYILKRKA